MDFKGPDFILVVFVIFKVTKGQYGVPTEKFVMSIDVSVLESLFLTCFTKNDLRSTLEATVICSDEEGCRAVTRPNHWCECPLEPTLRKWKSNTLWLQARLWKPRIPWRKPNVSLPVDNIINSILQGSISGDVSGEITIVPRGAGSGLEFDGVSGYVDFGMHHDECFQSPDACKDGVTFCMWLWMGNSDSPKVLILDSGGYLHARAGYNMRLGNGVLYVTVKFGDKNKHQYKVNDWNQDHWEHVAWTWHPAKGIRFFLNGCDTDPGATKGMSSHKKLNDLQPSNDASFVLGATSRTHVKMAKMKLDDLYIWYQVFTEHEIWMVYVNGETNFLA